MGESEDHDHGQAGGRAIDRARTSPRMVRSSYRIPLLSRMMMIMLMKMLMMTMRMMMMIMMMMTTTTMMMMID